VTTDTQRPSRLRFGIYEMDARTGEVWREAFPSISHPSRSRCCSCLASRAGDVVTREEIRQELWGQDTFVDFDGGLNFCINQIRKALRDNAESPRFIHTLPRRGYRFIASVEPVAVAPTAMEAASAANSGDGHVRRWSQRRRDRGGEDDGGARAARSGHLYEVMREPEPGARRWRPAGFSGFVRSGDEPGRGRGSRPRAGCLPACDTPCLAESESRALSPPPVTASVPPCEDQARVGPGWGLAIVLAAGIAAVEVARTGLVEPVYERLTFRAAPCPARASVPAGPDHLRRVVGRRAAPFLRHASGRDVARAFDLPERTIGQKILTTGELVCWCGATRRGAGLAPGERRHPARDRGGNRVADVSPDGTRIAVIRSGPEDRVELPPGHEIARAAAKLNFLRLAPAGDRVAFLSHPVPGDDRGEVVTVDAAGKRTVLSRDWASLEGLAWSADGREVWFTGPRWARIRRSMP
jgi:DNA-binding winged helix-turn-helix (wHTH) protein